MIHLFHCFIKISIGLYKWIELMILSLFSRCIERSINKKLKRIDVVLVEPPKDELIECNDTAKVSEDIKDDRVIRFQVNNLKGFLIDIVNRGHIAIGEGYMNGEILCENDENDITEFITRYLNKNYHKCYFNCWNSLLYKLEFESVNLQTPSRAWQVARKHYNLGNPFFSTILDKNMQYSCGYWANANNLEEAQIDKMELIARKLDLRPGMRVLDIGCGWGTLCKYLAENYGVECVGVTISKEGFKYAEIACSDLPIEIRLEDYRKMNQKFDRIISIEMFEHVGIKNHRHFFKVVSRCLKDDGIFLLQTAVITDSTFRRVDSWINAYVYPNISIAYASDIFNAIDGMFVMEDWHNMSSDMSETYNAWRENLTEHWPMIRIKHDETLYKMWIYLTSISIAAYKTKKLQLAQVVLTKATFPHQYKAER